jgi:hypothetical protein
MSGVTCVHGRQSGASKLGDGVVVRSVVCDDCGDTIRALGADEYAPNPSPPSLNVDRLLDERDRAWEQVAQLDRENAELRAELAGFRRREIAP